MGENPTSGELMNELSAMTDLSDREAEVVVNMAEEIERCETQAAARETVAEGLGIEPSTVDTHYRRALEKFHRAITLRELALEESISAVFPSDETVELEDGREVPVEDLPPKAREGLYPT